MCTCDPAAFSSVRPRPPSPFKTTVISRPNKELWAALTSEDKTRTCSDISDRAHGSSREKKGPPRRDYEAGRPRCSSSQLSVSAAALPLIGNTASLHRHRFTRRYLGHQGGSVSTSEIRFALTVIALCVRVCVRFTIKVGKCSSHATSPPCLSLCPASAFHLGNLCRLRLCVSRGSSNSKNEQLRPANNGSPFV